jgi:N,N'-diacetyl-8-epilegionaminate cytidylyltransferase
MISINGKELKVFASILARGGSKGIVKKNIKHLSGKPLIAYSIEAALRNKYIDAVYVSTDDKDIADISIQNGAKVPFMRPEEISGDNASVWSGWQYSMEYFSSKDIEPDILIELPPTSPLRSDEDIDSCIEELVKSDCDAFISITDSKRHPMFNMIKVNDNGHAELLMESEKEIFRRQDAPIAFDITTIVYGMKKDFLMNSGNNTIWDGKVGFIKIPEERSLDIDTEFDFYLASLITSNKK